MGAPVEWLGRRMTDGGVVERRVRVGDVPGIVWSPPGEGPPPPLVLLGHGGSGHKGSAGVVAHARWFAGRAGIAAVAIDGPYHGDRVPAPLPAEVYQARMAGEGIEAVLDRMADDWWATVDALGAAGVADTERLGYLGMSMATRFGLPWAARAGDRLRCVVFGKFGLRQCAGMPAGLSAPHRVASDARRITAPALLHVPWHDEVFPADGQRALFEALGSRDKRLVGVPGPHAGTDPGAIGRWRDVIRRHLAPARS